MQPRDSFASVLLRGLHNYNYCNCTVVARRKGRQKCWKTLGGVFSHLASTLHLRQCVNSRWSVDSLNEHAKLSQSSPCTHACKMYMPSCRHVDVFLRQFLSVRHARSRELKAYIYKLQVILWCRGWACAVFSVPPLRHQHIIICHAWVGPECICRVQW